MTPEQQEKQRIYAARHWAKFGVALNAYRRELYRTDPAFRQNVIDRSHQYHETFCNQINAKRRQRYATESARRKKIKMQGERFRALLAAGHVPAPKPIYRTIRGSSVRVYRPSEAGRGIGCAQNTITRWYRDGWIPAPDIEGEKLFTAGQIEILKRFYSIPKHDHDKRSKVSKYIFDEWQR